MLDEQDYTRQIYFKAYIPYVIQLVSTSVLFFYFVPRGYQVISNDLNMLGLGSIFLRLVVFLTMLNNGWFELN